MIYDLKACIIFPIGASVFDPIGHVFTLLVNFQSYNIKYRIVKDKQKQKLCPVCACVWNE